MKPKNLSLIIYINKIASLNFGLQPCTCPNWDSGDTNRWRCYYHLRFLIWLPVREIGKKIKWINELVGYINVKFYIIANSTMVGFLLKLLLYFFFNEQLSHYWHFTSTTLRFLMCPSLLAHHLRVYKLNWSAWYPYGYTSFLWFSGTLAFTPPGYLCVSPCSWFYFMLECFLLYCIPVGLVVLSLHLHAGGSYSRFCRATCGRTRSGPIVFE